MSLLQINRTVKNIQRFQQIVNVLLKHGFAEIVERLGLDQVLTLGKRIATFGQVRLEPPPSPLTFPQRFRTALTELGPAYVKFGQILSTREDLLPVAMTRELEKLQDEVPPLPFEQVLAQIETSLGVPWDSIFASIEPTPLASASIAQVHGGRLQTGEAVVVKVQRPGIAATIDSDIGVLFTLAALIEDYIPESIPYAPLALVEEFARSIRRELDFLQEASNIEQFRRMLGHLDSVHIPIVYWDCVTPVVLTMERIRGIPMDDVEGLRKFGLEPAEIARIGAEIFMRQVLEHGVFHGDPHPGNVFILEDGRFCMLDFGNVGRLDREMRDQLVAVLFSLFTQDYDRLVRGLIAIGLVREDVDQRRLRRDLADLIDPLYGQPLSNLHVGPILQEVMLLAHKYETKPLPDLFVLARAFVLVEGVGRKLDPDMDIVSVAAPFVARMVRDRLNPQRLAFDTLRAGSDVSEMLRALPDQIRILLNKKIKNELVTTVRFQDKTEVLDVISQTGNRIALALTICAIIMGSGIIVLGSNNLAQIGFFGYIVAAVLGAWLVISIIRTRKY